MDPYKIVIRPLITEKGTSLNEEQNQYPFEVSLGANKFQVAERTQLATVMDEQGLGMSGAVDPATAARIGKLAGAGYMLIGVVTEADSSRRETRVYETVVVQWTSTLALDIRFVDSTKGLTMWAETFQIGRASCRERV